MIFAALASLFLSAVGTLAYDASRSDNVVAYWGQNSYGAGNPTDTANFQQKLAFYCNDDSIDVFPLSFMHVFFSTGGLPSINLANTCNTNDNKVFPGSQLPDCSFLAADIKACQAKGKLVTMSLGGATGGAGFTSDDQATKFADLIWNLLLGGKSSTRPFGDAVLDGIDLDIEGGSSTGYTAFVKQLRTHFNGASKKFIVTGAPQCVFPDGYLGNTISQVPFDALYVQFYNNWCGVQNFDNANAWNFGQWDNWAKTQSPNKDVKIFIGVPASTTAAGSGYISVDRVAEIASKTKAQYSSFGGVMFWDASQAYKNNRFDQAVKKALKSGSTGGNTPTSTTKGPAPTSGSCSAGAWDSSKAYTGGQQASYNGHLWTAKWWTQNETPGGASGVWTDNGPCKSSRFFRD